MEQVCLIIGYNQVIIYLIGRKIFDLIERRRKNHWLDPREFSGGKDVIYFGEKIVFYIVC